MTEMPKPLRFQLAEKLPRYSLILALQVDTGDGFQTINRLEGVRPDERKLRMRLDVQKLRWKDCKYFGAAELRVIEIDADGNPIQ